MLTRTITTKTQNQQLEAQKRFVCHLETFCNADEVCIKVSIFFIFMQTLKGQYISDYKTLKSKAMQIPTALVAFMDVT